MLSVSMVEYTTLDDAYKFFNHALFNDELPDCILIFHRKVGCAGYFWFEKWKSRFNGDKISELALNPDYFNEKTDMEILSTFAHELVHTWQNYCAHPSRGGYHNKEWANKMDSIGLTPSHTGEIGGNRTGPKMSHFIVSNGKFKELCTQFLSTGKQFNWESIPKKSKSGLTKSKQSRCKYSCHKCGFNAWSKYNSNIICGECLVRMDEFE